MRRTKKDIKVLYDCYCRCWQYDDIERVRRFDNHGWVMNVWIREYDGIVRMSPTERGKKIVTSYYDTEGEIDVVEFLDDI